ncbi:hypothetical protein [Desulfoluna sp.]|uniref:hypothetical protein n=1 Tax=Desulfoluna sp. TaxID=2045199 RepID=UPI002637B651|nr:hypothetical protein [Desulfoluna sp.]
MTNPTNEPLSFRDLIDLGARYIWPLIVCWNVYMFQQIVSLKNDNFDLRLTMAQEYSSKADIEKMFTDFGARFSDFETRFDKRLDERFSVFEQLIKK